MLDCQVKRSWIYWTTGTYLEPAQTTMMKLFLRKYFPLFFCLVAYYSTKKFHHIFWQDSKYTSERVKSRLLECFLQCLCSLVFLVFPFHLQSSVHFGFAFNYLHRPERPFTGFQPQLMIFAKILTSPILPLLIFYVWKV